MCKKNILFILKIIIFVFASLNSFINCEEVECPREKPIKVGENCISKYCDNSEFESGDCIKSNSIIRAQWLNNIISVGGKDYRYIYFVTTSNNEMIFYTTPYPYKKERTFFGINSIGEPIFQDSDNKDIYIIEKDVVESVKRFEAVTGLIKINGDSDKNKEYLISFAKENEQYTELFDFYNYNNKIGEFSNKNIFGDYNTEFYIGSLLNLVEDNKNYCIIAILYRKYNIWTLSYLYYFLLMKFYFYSNIIEPKLISTKEFSSLEKKIVNCYLGKNNIIVCMYVTDDSKYKILFLNTNLKSLGGKELSRAPSSITFFKFFHFLDDLDVFIYYKGKSSNDYPTIELYETNIINYSVTLKKSIPLNKYNFINQVTLTDGVKIRDNLICLSAPESKKEQLIIVLINFFNNLEYNIRYYLIDIFSLYNKKFFREIKLHIYNNNIVLGFNYCQQSECDDTDHPHNTSLIFFSYPNINENNLDIIEYLDKNENNEVIFDLFDNAIIDNNIFGFTLVGILIHNIDKCGINLISLKTKKKLGEEDIIVYGDKIKLEFTENIYQILNCIISYSLIISEPEFNEYNKYPSFIYNEQIFEEEKKSFKQSLYPGKIGIFTLLIKQKLTTICQDNNCNLCLIDNKLYCLICENEYNFNNNGKICLEKEEESNISNNSNEFNISPKISDISNQSSEPKISDKSSQSNNEPKISDKSSQSHDEPKISDKSSQSHDEPKISDKSSQSHDEPKISDKSSQSLDEPKISDISNKSDIPNEFSKSDISNKPNPTNTYINIIEYNECEKNEILLGLCPNVPINNEQFKDLYRTIKKDIQDKKYSNKSVIIPTKDADFEVMPIEGKLHNNSSLSSIDFGPCLNIIKQQYEIQENDSLVLFKIDIKNENQNTPNVKFELYDPYNSNQVNLSYCNGLDYKITIPINLDLKTTELYYRLKNQGYDLFDENDPFFNDICATYTTENETDIINLDRQLLLGKYPEKYKCQEGCLKEKFDTEINNFTCKCQYEEDIGKEGVEKEPDLEEIITKMDSKRVGHSFFRSLTNSNFRVLICYKLVFDFRNFKKNIGMIIMTLIYLISIVLLLYYCFKERKLIVLFIDYIIKLKFFSKCLKNYNYTKKGGKRKESNSLKIKKFKNINQKNNLIKNGPPRNKKLKKNSNKSSSKTSMDSNISLDFKKHHLNTLANSNSIEQNIKIKNKMEISKINENTYKSSIIKQEKRWLKEFNSLNSFEFIRKNRLIEEELNRLEYELAIKKDNRTFFQYYLSLVKRKQLILFTFLHKNDYNLISIKIFLFLMSISLSFGINGFFFTDATMHNILEDNGGYNFLYQFAHIIYSTTLCGIIGAILRVLSLSEKEILQIKSQDTFENAIKISEKIQKYIRTKVIIFYVISYIFLSFFWYFISAFCIVYNNTQMILIKDTLVSFCLSMVYPFVLNLITTFCRIYALRARKRNKKCLYKCSFFIGIL